MSSFFYINKFTANTKDNIQTVYENLMAKYNSNNSAFILFNKKYYSLCHKVEDYFSNRNILDLDLPYPDDIMSYINSVEQFYEDEFLLERFIVKINNDLDNWTQQRVLEDLENLHTKGWAEAFNSIPNPYLINLIEDSPEIVAVCKKFTVNNLLLK